MEEARIVYVGLGAPSNGAPHQAMASLWLARKGYPIHAIFAAAGGVDSGEVPYASLDMRTYRSGGIKGQWRLLLAILKARKMYGASTVFYVQGSPNCPAALFGLVGVPRARVIYHTQDFLEPRRHKAWEFFERLFARRAGSVIVNDPSRGRFLASYYGLRRQPAVVRTALPADWPLPERDEALRTALMGRVQGASCRHLVMVGGPANPVRCTSTLLVAASKLPPDYALVFTGVPEGSAAYQRTMDAVEKSGLAERSLLLGYLPFESLLAHMAVCDVGILLYPDDGVGNFFQAPGRLTEYLSVGLPFVASRFPSFELLVAKYGAGAVCDQTSPASIARAIESVVGVSADSAQARRDRLRHVARTELAYDRQAPAVERVVDEALSG